MLQFSYYIIEFKAKSFSLFVILYISCYIQGKLNAQGLCMQEIPHKLSKIHTDIFAKIQEGFFKDNSNHVCVKTTTQLQYHFYDTVKTLAQIFVQKYIVQFIL